MSELVTAVGASQAKVDTITYRPRGNNLEASKLSAGKLLGKLGQVNIAFIVWKYTSSANIELFCRIACCAEIMRCTK